METNNNKPLLSEEQEDNINIADVFLSYLSYWKWFVGCVIISLSITFFYLAKQNNLFMVTTSVLLNNEKGGGNADAVVLESLGLSSAGRNNVDNEIEVMRSKNLMKQIVEDLGIFTTYTCKDGMRNIDLYGISPITVNIDSLSLQHLASVITVNISPVPNSDKYEILATYGGEEKEIAVSAFPVKMELSNAILTIDKSKGAELPDKDIKATIYNPSVMATILSHSININLSNKNSTILTLSYNTENIRKGKDILSKVVYYYNKDAMAEKNRVATNTEVFIDERIALLSQELIGVEKDVEQYRKEHKITNIESEAGMFLNQTGVTDSKLFELETQLNLINYVDDFISNKSNAYNPIPNLGITDAGLASSINEYNQQLLVRSRLQRSTSENNPSIIDMNHDIAALCTGIFRGLEMVRKGITIAKRDLQGKDRQLESKIKAVPQMERELTEIIRQQEIKAQLFVFLLEKREENSLSKTLTVPIARIIDEPDSIGGPVSPKRSQTLLIALLAGLLIPALVIFLRDVFNVKFKDKSDIEKLTRTPILGEISNNNTDSFFVVKPKSTEPIVELFRLIRNNLQFILSEPDKKVVCVTSTVTGEGKTFFSVNLALGFAITDKKVLLVGLDIRRPRLGEHFSTSSKQGITSYLSGQETDLSSLIIPSGMIDNFDLLPAGAVPPNPNELLINTRLDDAFNELRKKYDYIIVDTAPVGMVSDTFLLNRIADVNIYITRANYSSKKYLSLLNTYVESNKLSSVYLVVNDVDMKARAYSYRRYGYGYGYGYKGYGGYGYNEKNYQHKK